VKLFGVKFLLLHRLAQEELKQNWCFYFKARVKLKQKICDFVSLSAANSFHLLFLCNSK